MKMPPLGYHSAPQPITDWLSMRPARALVRRELSGPGSAEFPSVRISGKTLFDIKTKGFDARVFIQLEETEMAALFESTMAPCR
jgi:hypothetical protein